MNTNLRKQAILLFCILMFCYSYVHQNLGWNQNSRLDLLRGLVLYGTFKIDADHENTGDKSVQDGHYYSDKAPGIAFLALPAFSLSVAILNALDVPLDSPRAWLASSWITTVGSVSWITALGGVAMFVFLSKLVGQRYAFISILAVFLGSLPFPYATMLFSHAAVIGLISIALWTIADPVFFAKILPNLSVSPSLPSPSPDTTPPLHTSTTPIPSPWLGRHLLAGLCCGLAISSEYTAATAAGGVLALALLTGFQRAFVLALAAIPPLLLIPFYNWMCFGSPLAFGYHHLALPQFQEMNKGLFGITFPPKASAFYLLLISPERGLFFWSPFFLMALFGLKTLFKLSHRLFCVSGFIIIIHIVCIAGYYMPNGGAALGPRHLAPMIPFMIMCAALGLRRFPLIGISYAAYSIFLCGIATVIDAMPPDNVNNPALSFYGPRFLRTAFANTFGFQLGLPQLLSIVPLLFLLFAPFIWVWMNDKRHFSSHTRIAIEQP